MKGNLKIIGSNNQIMPLDQEYFDAELIENKLIVNSPSMARSSLKSAFKQKVLTLDIKYVNIYDKHVHVDAWFVDEELNGGRVEFTLHWK